ncbi:restriction endonuclease subunit S [Arthrobacter sp. YAF17]|uniref:restriction endonuclease subunit S n=1 Tax=Arthrobacter sp. YAF17 TaxID=3233077 RepID=UPI003F8DAE8E
MSLNLDRAAWKRVAFGDVVRNVSDTIRDPEAAGIDRLVAMEHLDRGELKIMRWGSPEDGTTFTRRVTPGQTLFGKRRAYQRKVAYAEFDAICSGDILTLEADESQLLSGFLPFLVQSDDFFDHALGTSAGSLSPRTNWRDLSNFEFDLPPLDEQQRIADLLWAIERHRRAVAAVDGPIQACQVPLLAVDTDAYVTVGDVVTIARSGATPLRSNKDFFGGSIPWLKSGEVVGDGITTTEESITDMGLAGSAASLVPSGAVVVAMYGDGKTRGQVGRIGAPMSTNQAVLALVADPSKADPDFLYYWLRSRQGELRNKGAGAAQKNLSKVLVVSEPFPALSVADQAAAVKQVIGLDVARGKVTAECTALTTLRAVLLAEVFGGN